MPATMMHLYAAKLFCPEGSDSYFLGSILPDCVDAHREWKDRLHFRDFSKEERLPALVSFGKEMDLEKEFNLGVLYHFYLDYLWDYGPQSDHRKIHGEENWFFDYRKELSRAGNSVSHRFPWCAPLWEKLRSPDPNLYENTLSLPEEEIVEFLEKNYHFHLETKLPKGEFFTDELVDSFTQAAADSFHFFLQENFPAVAKKYNEVPMRKEKVLVILGGKSSEREISLRSGTAVAKALKEKFETVQTLDISKNNLSEIASFQPDVVFIALHGKGGEDGAVQGLLEWMEIPYTGPGIAASAICMDKILTKKILTLSGVPTPKFLEIGQNDKSDPKSAVEKAIDTLGLPLVLKACRQGSSIGTVIVREKEGAEEALKELFSYGDEILAEAFLSGMELTVPVMGNEELCVLPPIEITSQGQFYDFESKYMPGGSEHIIPARVSKDTEAKLRDLAVKAYRAAGCRGLSRIDIMLDEKGDPQVIEINTLPGMTETSLFPDAARAVGISFADLCEKLCDYALEK